MSKTNKTIEISDLYRAIKIVQNEISMKEKTLQELDELGNKCGNTKKQKNISISKELLLKDLEETHQKLATLKRLSTGNTAELDGYVVDVNETTSCGKYLNQGEVSYIDFYRIKEPTRENLFLIHGLEEFGITEADVVSYYDNTSNKKLTITIRDNVVDCPIVKFNSLANNSRNKLRKDIFIEILSPQLTPIYKILYKEPVVRCLGDLNGAYDSCKPLVFTVTLSYRVREMEKIENNGTTN